MIVGLTGRNASGKGEVAEILKEHGFLFHSLSDVIRDEIRAQGHRPTRDRLIAMGWKLREDHGEGHLASVIRARLANKNDFVVDSFRHPAEVGVFREQGGFSLILVEAPAETRYERILGRGRESDPQTLEEFVRVEAAEVANPNSPGQQLDVCASLADIVIHNQGTLVDLREAVIREVAQLKGGSSDPPGLG